jgi:hypothetical protein
MKHQLPATENTEFTETHVGAALATNCFRLAGKFIAANNANDAKLLNN